MNGFNDDSNAMNTLTNSIQSLQQTLNNAVGSISSAVQSSASMVSSAGASAGGMFMPPAAMPMGVGAGSYIPPMSMMGAGMAATGMPYTAPYFTPSEQMSAGFQALEYSAIRPMAFAGGVAGAAALGGAAYYGLSRGVPWAMEQAGNAMSTAYEYAQGVPGKSPDRAEADAYWAMGKFQRGVGHAAGAAAWAFDNMETAAIGIGAAGYAAKQYITNPLVRSSVNYLALGAGQMALGSGLAMAGTAMNMAIPAAVLYGGLRTMEEIGTDIEARDVISANSSRYFHGNQGRGFNLEQTGQLARNIGKIGAESMMSDGSLGSADIVEMMKNPKFNSYMYNANDVTEATDKIKTLVKNVRSIALAFGETIEQATDTVMEMKRMGIASEGDVKSTYTMVKAGANVSGFSTQELMQMTANAGAATRGTAFAPGIAAPIAAITASLATNSGIPEHLLTNLGGVQGLANQMTAQTMNFVTSSPYMKAIAATAMNADGSFDINKIRGFATGSEDLYSVMSRGAANAITPEQMARFQAAVPKITSELGGTESMMLMFKTAQAAGKQLELSGLSPEMAHRQAIMNMTGGNTALTEAMLKMEDKMPQVLTQMQESANYETKRQFESQLADRHSLLANVRRGITHGAEGAKNVFMDYAVDPVLQGFRDFGDWFSGYERIRTPDFMGDPREYMKMNRATAKGVNRGMSQAELDDYYGRSPGFMGTVSNDADMRLIEYDSLWGTGLSSMFSSGYSNKAMSGMINKSIDRGGVFGDIYQKNREAGAGEIQVNRDNFFNEYGTLNTAATNDLIESMNRSVTGYKSSEIGAFKKQYSEFIGANRGMRNDAIGYLQNNDLEGAYSRVRSGLKTYDSSLTDKELNTQASELLSVLVEASGNRSGLSGALVPTIGAVKLADAHKTMEGVDNAINAALAELKLDPEVNSRMKSYLTQAAISGSSFKDIMGDDYDILGGLAEGVWNAAGSDSPLRNYSTNSKAVRDITSNDIRTRVAPVMRNISKDFKGSDISKRFLGEFEGKDIDLAKAGGAVTELFRQRAAGTKDFGDLGVLKGVYGKFSRGLEAVSGMSGDAGSVSAEAFAKMIRAAGFGSVSAADVEESGVLVAGSTISQAYTKFMQSDSNKNMLAYEVMSPYLSGKKGGDETKQLRDGMVTPAAEFEAFSKFIGLMEKTSTNMDMMATKLKG